MKKIFIILFIASFSFASAQDNGKPYLKIVPRKSGTNIYDVTPLVNPSTQALPQAKLLFTLPDGNKVYALPLDNMPCLVPDLSRYNMPVLKPDMSQFNMPNLAGPSTNKPVLVPQAISPEKLMELQKQGKVIFK